MNAFRKLVAIFILLTVAANCQAKQQLDFQISGVTGDTLSNVQSRLNLAYKALGDKPSKISLEQFYNAIDTNVEKSVQPFGYFRAKVNHRIRTINRKKRLIIINIIPGKVLRVTKTSIRITGVGKNDAEFIKYRQDFPLKPGSPLLIKQYNDAKKKLYNIAEARGFLTAKMKRNQIIVDLERYTAKIILHLDTGPHFYFGDLSFAASPFANAFLQRYVHFQEGQSYSTADLLLLQDRLSSSGYFQHVMVKPDFDKVKNRHIPIEVSLIPRKSQQYTIGVGYDGTQETLRGTLGFNWRYVNAYGHRFQAIVQGSQIESAGQATYIIPGKNPVTDQFNISAAFVHSDLNDVKSNAARLGVAMISNWREWQRTLSLTGLIERQFDSASQPTKVTNWLYPTINLRRVRAKNTLSTKNGYMINFMLQGAVEGLASDDSFLQFRFDSKYIRTLKEKTRLILRGTLGVTAIDNINNLAPTLQFRTGGAQSIRGYGYKSLGPGRYLAIASAEMQHVIIGKWYAAIFYDIGNSFNNWGDPVKQTAGIGLVRLSPVGSINIGVAKRINDKSEAIEFVFSIGPDLA